MSVLRPSLDDTTGVVAGASLATEAHVREVVVFPDSFRAAVRAAVMAPALLSLLTEAIGTR